MGRVSPVSDKDMGRVQNIVRLDWNTRDAAGADADRCGKKQFEITTALLGR
jgi:hypothetical protein